MPSPFTHSTLLDFIRLLNRSIDSYNADDLTLSTATTIQNTSGEVARICINQALQNIYSLIKDSKYLDAYPSTKFTTEIGKDYLELAVEASLDDIESVTDTTDNFRLVKKSWNWYRRNYPDPSDGTGPPRYYIRRNERVYFAPRPSVARNLVFDFRKATGELKLNGDLSLLPTQYDFWIIAEAKVRWFEMIDPDSVPLLIVSERNDARANALASVLSDYDSSLQAGLHIERREMKVGAWDRL